jgi:hypothetical protein
MKTLRSIVLEMYKRAEKRVSDKLQKKKYLTWEEFDQCLQIEFNRVEGYYIKKHNVDPFSEEFVDIVFKEYENSVISALGLKTLIPPQEEAELIGGGLLGFNEKLLHAIYLKTKLKKCG